MRKSLVGILMFACAVSGASACATKGFVRTEVSKVNSKTDTLGQSLEQTQERLRQTEGRVGEVDSKATAAQQSADKANQAAAAADQRAGAAGESARMAGEKADAVDKSTKRLMYTVVLNQDEGGFAFNKADLPDEAKAKIDEMVKQIIADPKGAYFEIEGHTDNVGPKDVNARIGEERAEAVKRYLYTQYQIPLHRMNVISYGQEKPVGDNKTKEGRAQNRRVVIKVLI